MNNKDFDFVARHYRHGAFSTKAGWRRLGIASPMRWYRRAAAAAAVAAVLGATATVLYFQYGNPDRPRIEQAQPDATPAQNIVRAIDFDNAPLTAVIAEMENIYGVQVGGVPDDADSLIITLYYNGDAEGLIAVINEILDTDMTVIPAE